MSDVAVPPAIGDNECLARFITSSKWIRTSDKTVKQDAFIPYPYPDLSVTRHGSFSQQELWEIGKTIAAVRPATLYGRADVTAQDVRRQKLGVEPRPVPENLNHASIIGWPIDKPAQKSYAQELAAAARYVPAPEASL
jgi:hypothetical protein